MTAVFATAIFKGKFGCKRDSMNRAVLSKNLNLIQTNDNIMALL